VTPPTITPPPDVISKATGTLTKIDLGMPTVTDTEDPNPSVTNDAPTNGFPVGTTTINWVATDATGNFATATQKVTIQNADTYYTIPTIAGIKPTKVTYGSTVHTVCDSGCTHTTIKSAIGGLPSAGGKVVLKAPKTFTLSSTTYLRSNLVIEFQAGASITYSGTGPAIYGKNINNVMLINPVISISTTVDAIYLESVDTIIIDGGKIAGVKSSSNAGIKCNNCKNILVENGSYSRFARPIHIGTIKPDGCDIQICKLTGDTRNVWLVGNEIFNSNIECVHLNYAYDVHTNDNNIHDCVGNGLDVGFNSGAEARNNKIYNAGWGTKDKGQGIHTDSTNTVVLIGNKVDFSGTQGIQVCGSDKNYIIGNTVSRSGRVVTDTLFPGHGTGINIIPCSGFVVEYTVVDQNTITDSNDGYGVYIAFNSKPTYLTNNVILNNEKGAYRDDSKSATIAGNTTK
jgi:parallel beta-helix repeat protein